MSQLLPSSQLVLYIWPGKWDLASIDPLCLAAIIHLQLAAPGEFNIIECTNPDLSPSGRLPFLVHERVVVSSFPSIINYVAGLKQQQVKNTVNLDIYAPSGKERSQSVAWQAHVDANLGDLVSYMFYSVDANWSGITHPAFASVLPLPQRYYVPGRIRESFRLRLEAVGLWNLPDIEQEKKRPFQVTGQANTDKRQKTDKFLRVFEREKVIEKARTSFDLYSRLLGDKRFFYHDRPTVLDIVLAAYMLLLLKAPFPDPLLQTVITESYPTLMAHAYLIQSLAFPPSSKISTITSQSYFLSSLVPKLVFGRVEEKKTIVKHEEEVRFAIMRWAWIALSSVGVFGVAVSMGLRVQARIQRQIEEIEEEEEER